MMYRFQPLLFQPVLSRLSFSLTELLEEVRSLWFPELSDTFEARIAAEGPMAYISRNFMGTDKHLVVFHPLLNHPETPREVLRFLCKHELTHVVFPPRVIDRCWEHHPPEFWEHEAAIGPERHAVWAWTHRNFDRTAWHHPEGGYYFSRRWTRFRDTPRLPYTPALPFGEPTWDRVCPGSQLKLPPDWPPRPLTAAVRQPLHRAWREPADPTAAAPATAPATAPPQARPRR